MRRRDFVVTAGLAAVAGLSGSGTLVGLRAAAVAQSAGSRIRHAVVADGSEVRYRVREQLAGLSFPNDAVGATRAVEGQLVLDGQGRVVPGESRFTVDLRTLRSDEPRRDSYLRRNTLETERYPAAVLVPVELRGLPVPPPDRGTAAFELIGDFTVRETTRRLTWPSTATIEGTTVRVQARTAFRFGDFGLRIPRVSVVLSVEDDIRLEADLHLQRTA
jgi:polyisoprenoid-binding protein YceI